MDVKIKVKRHEAFDPLYTAREKAIDLIIAIGGRGGMKTYEVSKFLAFDATIKQRRISVMRDEKETIRESILNEIFSRFNTANKYGHFDGKFECIETGIRNKASGEMAVFTKGFRASSNEKRSNLKGVSEVNTVVIEEAEDIRDPQKFNTFVDSIRTQDRLIVVILNTPDIQHWIIKRYFNLEAITIDDVPELRGAIKEDELDGYFKLVAKKLPGFASIQTSFADNEHLPEAVVRSYKSYGDKESPNFDLHYYLTAIKGFASSGRKGQILKKVKPIKLADYLALPFKEIYGQDFGTSAPAGIVGVKMDGNALYARQLNYLPLDTLSIAKKFIEVGITADDIIIADSADPIAIGRLRRGWLPTELDGSDKENAKLLSGFNIRGAIKGPGSIEHGLSMLKGMRLFFVEESADLWMEVMNYVYATNKSGEFTNDPIDDFNHLIDPIRYIAASRGRYF